MRLKTILIGITVIILSPIIIVLGRSTLLQLAGYDVDKDPKDLAQEIYDEGDSVSRCINLQWSLPTMGPTLDDQRSRCVLEYADIAKDPKACQLIMPSNYGLTCVGYAEDPHPCSYVHDDIFWEDNGVKEKTNMENCAKDEQKSFTGAACCLIANISRNENENDCSSLVSDERLFNQCVYMLAFKKRDPSLCGQISKRRTKDACEVMTKAVRDDPSIIK
jgi:hypothetical protein